MTPEQIIAVMAKMKMLDPGLVSGFTGAQLEIYINMAYMIIQAAGIEIPSDRFVLAVAVKALALLVTPENSSLSKKKIKDVEITYYQGQGKSKWDVMFDAIVSGEQTDLTLNYVGI